MKKQIKDFLAGAGEHFAGMAKAHQAARDGYEPDSTEHTFHSAAMDECTGMADKCVSACKALQNADESDFGKFARDFSELIPTNVSAVVPTAPQHARSYRAVPRAGQPPASSVPDVSDEFQKLFAIDDAS